MTKTTRVKWSDDRRERMKFKRGTKVSFMWSYTENGAKKLYSGKIDKAATIGRREGFYIWSGGKYYFAYKENIKMEASESMLEPSQNW